MAGYELNTPDPPPPPGQPSLLNEGDIPCPSCGKPISPGAVVCLNCGHDLASGGRVKTAVGEEARPETVQPIVREKGLSQKAAATIGIILLALAMFLALWFCKPDTALHIRGLRALLVAVQSATAVGTGLAAIWFAAWLLQRPYGRADLAAARLLLIVSLFFVCFNLVIPVPILGTILKLAAAAGLYYTATLALIGRDAKTTGYIILAHATATILILAQSWLWSVTNPFIEW